MRIVGWARYQHADSKRYASGMPWVKCPTSHTGLGYLEIMDHADGMAHFGAWVLILQVAAKCPPGGILVTDSGKPILARELALKTRGNADIFSSAIDRLVTVGWLEWTEVTADSKLTASGQQADSTRTSRQEEIRGEEIRQDKTTTTTSGGVVEVDPDKDQDDPSEVVAPQQPPAAVKPPVSFADWVMHGHGRVHMDRESRGLWESLWRRLHEEWTEPIKVMDAMYAALIPTLEQPRYKIWPVNADEWIRNHVT